MRTHILYSAATMARDCGGTLISQDHNLVANASDCTLFG
jgi:hypothetical protein